jgi:hypothetical protein
MDRLVGVFALPRFGSRSIETRTSQVRSPLGNERSGLAWHRASPRPDLGAQLAVVRVGAGCFGAESGVGSGSRKRRAGLCENSPAPPGGPRVIQVNQPAAFDDDSRNGPCQRSACGDGQVEGFFFGSPNFLFGLEPFVYFTSGLIAAQYVEFVRSAADTFFEWKRFGRGFFCACGGRHEIYLPQPRYHRQAGLDGVSV